jgi:iron complex outermembrane receptor protein
VKLHSRLILSTIVLCGVAALARAGENDPSELGEILVTATLRPDASANVPTSVSVLTARMLEESGVQHFQDVLALVPNLNWAAGSSRPRNFQLRGIGDLEQYQGAPNPSVAFLIDDIDLSGVGMPATLLDVEQIEVLRGPQGTRYGANALAGLIAVKTADADTNFEARTEATLGDSDTRAIGGVIGGALPGVQGGAIRLVAQRYESDGFRHNAFLGRDDTNGRDERTVRLKLHLGDQSAFSADFTGLFVDLDDGYDAFAIDNSRTTQSDDPGRDAQRTSGGAARLHWAGERFDVLSITSYADSHIDFRFDGDWGNDAFWAPFAPYDFTSSTQRERRTLTQDLRVASSPLDAQASSHAWLVGAYGRRLEEDNRQDDVFNGEVFRALASEFDARSVALYGEIDWRVTRRLDLGAGLRLERREATYQDNEGPSFDPAEDMVGGHLSAEWHLSSDHMGYATLARGYKNGGFNIGAVITPDRREFRPEYLWNLETGLKSHWLGGRVQTELALFYMRREDQQEQTSFQLDPGDPLSFVFYTDNAAKGENYGAEASLRWRASESVRFDASLGLLETRYIEYVRPDADLSGREQTHAPNWQYALGITWRHPLGFMAHADLTGRDGFYFSASHAEREGVAHFLNLKTGFEGERWTAYLWGANVLDEDYSQLGFFFGNEPPDFIPKRYTQAGDPRQFGATLIYRFE